MGELSAAPAQVKPPCAKVVGSHGSHRLVDTSESRLSSCSDPPAEAVRTGLANGAPSEPQQCHPEPAEPRGCHPEPPEPRGGGWAERRRTAKDPRQFHHGLGGGTVIARQARDSSPRFTAPPAQPPPRFRRLGMTRAAAPPAQSDGPAPPALSGGAVHMRSHECIIEP